MCQKNVFLSVIHCTFHLNPFQLTRFTHLYTTSVSIITQNPYPHRIIGFLEVYKYLIIFSPLCRDRRTRLIVEVSKSLTDTPYSVELLWTSDRPVA